MYYLLHDPTILIEKVCKLFLTVKFSFSVMLTVENNFKTFGFFQLKSLGCAKNSTSGMHDCCYKLHLG
jgi:hypothetical protein